MTWNIDSISVQRGRVAIVTGANSGIGYETARILASKGAEVILACRSEAKGRDAVSRISESCPGAKVTLMPLDLSNLASVRQFADDFKAAHQRLDLLVNNAGVMMTPNRKTEDGFELQFGTNHLGHFALTALLFERLSQTPGSRVVTVSSLAHRMGKVDFTNLNAERRYGRTRAYAQSKLANLLFTAELQRRVDSAGLDIRVAAAHPGWTATNLQNGTPTFKALNPLMAQTPLAGALPTLYAATADEVTGGGYYGPGGWLEMRGQRPKRAHLSRRARDSQTAQRLWQASESLTGVLILNRSGVNNDLGSVLG